LPLAATLASPHIVAAFQTDDRAKTFFHGHSFTAHPLACAVGVANWRLLTAGRLEAPSRIEHFWRQTLEPLRNLAMVEDVRVQGSIAAVELKQQGGYLAKIGSAIRDKAMEHGVLLRPLGNVVYAMPPLQTTADSLRRIAEAIGETVKGLK
jgi:adenosylmethionine-8-amino-7-oxononanoate aminotransferase